MVKIAIATEPDQRIDQRRRMLVNHGATTTEIDELLAYNQNIFVWESAGDVQPEAHIQAWQEYLADAINLGVWESLRRRLIQLQFPVQLGISETAAYRSSTRRGVPVPDGTVGVELRSPQQLELFMHESWAGLIPVIFAGDRADFELLVQALLRRNEPVPVPAATGACMVAGFNNWDRIRSYREQWELVNGAENWEREWQRLMPQKSLYQDRLMILSDSPYSNVQAMELGLAADVWRRQSRKIRLEHESIHYWTKRRLGAMQNKVLDELMADYWGLVATTGEYRADWFLRFLGLENWPIYRSSGRLSSYQGNPALSAGAFRVLQSLVVAAARNLEWVHSDLVEGQSADEFACLDSAQQDSLAPELGDRLANAQCVVEALSCLTLEEIAAPGGVAVLAKLALDFKK